MLLTTEKKYESFLYSYFHEFHSELMQIKQQVQDQDWQRNMLTKTSLPESLPFRMQLLTLLDKQSINSTQRWGEHGGQLYRELKYLMVALADEFFLHLLRWDGQEIWRKELLERNLFSSQAAGQKIFEKIETILKQRDPITLELARIYLIVLALGFQGRYRDNEDKDTLFHYRRQLFSFITQRDPGQIDQHLNYDENLRICPQAYQHTYTETAKSSQLPYISSRSVAVFVLFFLLFFTSILLWISLSSDLNTKAANIIQRKNQPDVLQLVVKESDELKQIRLLLGETEQKLIVAEERLDILQPQRNSMKQQLDECQRKLKLEGILFDEWDGLRSVPEARPTGFSPLKKDSEELTALKRALFKTDQKLTKAEEIAIDLERQIENFQQRLNVCQQKLKKANQKASLSKVWEGLLFKAGSAEPKSIPTERLNELVEFLQQETDATIEIIGHTDNSGSSQTNLRLSQSRAEAIRDLLVKQGIAVERIKAIGLGESQPVADNATKKGRSLNRRVEIKVF